MTVGLDRHSVAPVVSLHRDLAGAPAESGLEQGLSIHYAVPQRAVLRRGHARPILYGARHHALRLVEEGELNEDKRHDEEDREGNCRLDQRLPVLASPSTLLE
jgi:hypothetical protein